MVLTKTKNNQAGALGLVLCIASARPEIRSRRSLLRLGLLDGRQFRATFLGTFTVTKRDAVDVGHKVGKPVFAIDSGIRNQIGM